MLVLKKLLWQRVCSELAMFCAIRERVHSHGTQGRNGIEVKHVHCMKRTLSKCMHNPSAESSKSEAHSQRANSPLLRLSVCQLPERPRGPSPVETFMKICGLRRGVSRVSLMRATFGHVCSCELSAATR